MFKEGQRVRCVLGVPNLGLIEGKVYVVHSSEGAGYANYRINGNLYSFSTGRFKEVQEETPMQLSIDPVARKGIPITSGVLDYFPLAIAEVAICSKAGNDQHNPGQPLHWARNKSTDHADCIARHLIDRGTVDTDGIRHSAKLAWRALAQLQLELEQAAKDTR